MLRALVVALLLANLAFFAWTQGWLDSVVGMRAIGDREPERMARQVRPETVRILSAGSGASAPEPTVFACFEAGPFSEGEAAAASAAASAALPAGSWATSRVDQPGTWIVYMGKFPNNESLVKKEEELKRRKLPYDVIRDNPVLAPGLSLGRFDERGLATKALDQFSQQGVRTARVVELVPAVTRQWLRVEKADPALAAKLVALKAEAFGNGFAACAAAPSGR